MKDAEFSSRRSSKHAPRQRRGRDGGNERGRIVGVISNQLGGVAWVVSPHRKDKRTGAVSPVPWSPYAQQLLDCVSIGTVQWRTPQNSYNPEEWAYWESPGEEARGDLEGGIEDDEQNRTP